MNKQKDSYEDWLQSLEVLLGVLSTIKYPRRLCAKSWYMYYEEGLTVNQAIEEDLGNIKFRT